MAKRIDLCYGRSGSGKTTWCVKLAVHIFNTTGLKTRWLIGDGGFETVENTNLVEDGIVDFCQFNLRDNPMETTQFLCEGWWPADPLDPKSKLLSPKFDGVGFYVIEGLSVMSDYIMGNRVGGLSEQAARGAERQAKFGKEAGIGGGIDSPYVIKDGDTVFGGVSKSGYGFAQGRMLDLVERSRVLPGLVYWTAHERAIGAEDNDDRPEPLIGPDVAGKKLTGVIGRSFGNTIHMHQASKVQKSRDKTTNKEVDHLILEHRAYVKSHYDPDQKTFVKYYANNRMPPGTEHLMPEYFCPADPLEFYRILEEGKRAFKEKNVRKEQVGA